MSTHDDIIQDIERRTPSRRPDSKGVLLSIIIVNFNTPELTLRCIRSIYKYAPTENFEIILLDNASTEDIEDEIAASFPSVRFLETGENIGYAKANNLGIQNARGDFLLLLNSDTEFGDDTLQAMLDYMQFHPEVGVIGPRQVDAQGNFYPSCDQFPTLLSEIARKIIHYRLSIDDYRLRDYMDEHHANRSEVDWVSGSCLMVRRKVLQDSGLLDERFFMYFEDIDFCRRVQMAGWKIQYLPSQTIVHYGGQSAKSNLMHVMVENRRSQIYFARKHYGLRGGLLIRALILMKYGFNLLRWGMLYLTGRLLGFGMRRSYTMALIAKKILFVAMNPAVVRAEVPVLHGRGHAPKELSHPEPSRAGRV